MKKHLLIIAIALISNFTKGQIVNIPDAEFKRVLLTLGIDKNNDSQIQVSEAMTVNTLNLTVDDLKWGNIYNLIGIEFFTSLDTLICSMNRLTSLDLSKNTNLIYLDCRSNTGLTSLNVRKNTALTYLDCYGSQGLTSLDVSNNTALEYLNLWYNTKLTSLDVSKNIALNRLEVFSSPLTTLDVSKNAKLTFLNCSNTKLTSLDVTKNPALTFLSCQINSLTTLDVSKNTALTSLWCNNNQLTTLDVSKNMALTILHCGKNQLTTICINSDHITANWEKDITAEYSTTCNTITGIENIYTTTSKQLYRILTPLGQEIKLEQALEGVYIYQYSDGSTKKVMISGK